MSSTPWTVQRSKRKSPTTSSTSRKRARFSDDVVRRSSTPRSNNQKTLTQIAFVGPSPTHNEENTDLQEMLVPNRRRSRISATKPRRLTKQDSTLTQMPWLENSMPAVDTVDDALLLNPIDDTVEPPTIGQIDGASDSSQLHRGQHSSVDTGTNLPTPIPGVVSDTQGSALTGQTKRASNTPSTPKSSRRRSGRIASKTRVLPDDPDVPQKASRPSYYAVPEKRPRNTTYHPIPLLEIQDSTEYDSQQIDTLRTDQIQQYNLPQTPNRNYVASSQTPETIVRNTARQSQHKDVSPSKTTRTPLQERSTNIPPIPQSTRIGLGKGRTGHDESTKMPYKLSPPRRICVLKAPPRALLPRTRHVNGPQQDIYTLHATSSPRSENNKTSSSLSSAPTSLPAIGKISDEVETTDIPSSPPEVDTQASLPQLKDLLSGRKTTRSQSGGLPETAKSHYQAAACDSIDTQDFGRHNLDSAAQIDHGQMLLDIEGNESAPGPTRTAAEDPTEEVDESDVEMGSPILNDTQFDAELKQRTSSPTSNSGTIQSGPRIRLSDAVELLTPTQQRQTQVHFADEHDEEIELDPTTPIPAPRLVKRTSPANVEATVRHDDDEETGEPILPRLTRQPGTHITTSKILLNDISSSSTPPVITTQRAMTQKSIRPASMPRPSQMSTQEPTQSYFFSSIGPSINHTIHVDRISIKDSSSSDGHLNEIPEHDGQSRSQGPDVRLVIEDSDEELDDLDLDPATGSKHSARKPISRQTTKTSSSLKSIHITVSSSEHEQNPSSSPAFEPQAKRSRMSLLRHTTPRAGNNQIRSSVDNEILDVLADIPTSSPTPPPSRRQHSPIPGFDNDTQSDFTQNGHVTAAYIHKQRDLGRYPAWFVPKPTSVGGSRKRKLPK